MIPPDDTILVRPAAELDYPLVAERTQSAEHRVGIDAKDRGQIPGRRESFAGTYLALGNCPPDSRRDLLM